jgi:hypothetical protein
MKKQSTLSAGLAAAAKREPEVQSVPQTKAASSKTVLIGAQFPPEVRRVLLLVQAEPENTGKTLKDLLGEAINDLCVKYRKPQPYAQED